MSRLRALADALPEHGAVTLTREDLLGWLADARPSVEPEVSSTAEPPAWRERIWGVPAAMLLSAAEAAEAVARSRDWCYRHAAQLGGRRMDGGWVFCAGDLREWLGRGHVLGAGSRDRIRWSACGALGAAARHRAVRRHRHHVPPTSCV